MNNNGNITLDTQTCVSAFIYDLNETMLFTSLNNENLNLVGLIKFNIKNIIDEVLFDAPYPYKLSNGTNGVISIVVNYFLIFNVDIIYEMDNNVPIYKKYDYTIDCENYIDNIEYVNILIDYFNNKKELHKIYRILIGFILPEQLGSVLCLPLSRNWSSNSIIIIRNKEALQHGIDISNFHNITDNDLNKFRKYEVKYTHNVLLHWEEITDKSYLNFIIDSTIISLNKLINQRALGYKNYVINKEDVRIEFRINPINQIK